MNNSEVRIDSWLLGADSENDYDNSTVEPWQSGFDADRQIVHSKIGPYKKIFIRPEKFVPRFYHTLYPLTIEEWQCTEQVKLYDDFCTIDITLDVRFQATFQYALKNIEILSELNEHIKNAYHDMAFDCVHKALLNLSDGGWVREGLEPIEKNICLAVNEMLIVQNIQSQVICKLRPTFEEFPDVQFAKEAVYLSVLKKSFEFNEQQNDEVFRQQQSEEKQKIEHKRLQFKQFNESAELDRQRQALQAKNNCLLLDEKAQQQLQQFEIKKQIHADKLKHSKELNEMSLTAELKEKQEQKSRVRVNEAQEITEAVTHEAQLKTQALEAEIAEYEQEQVKWRDAKDKTHIEELDLKHRQKQLEFDTDVGYKKRYEVQRLAMQEESFSARKKSDVYLKREIELLELEKKRLALQLSIKDYKNKEKDQDHSQEE